MAILDENRLPAAALAALEDDAAHLTVVLGLLEEQARELDRRRAVLRRQVVPAGAARLQRDLEIDALGSRLHVLSRLGHDVCLGRFDRADGSRTYVGRLGLRDADGRTLLADWRTPEAEPFFAATLADPRGLLRRRRFRWSGGRVVAGWDEWLDLAVEQEQTGLQDAQSAFLASLAANRTGRMSSVLATISADQDAVVREDGRGCTVVDGGPGTGKTVVALHRAAYLAFTRQDAVLYVTKSPGLAAYVRDVLPSLGEDDVPVVSLEQLYADRAVRRDPQPELARLKGDARMAAAVDRAVAFFQDLPQLDHEVVVRPSHWATALSTCEQTEHLPRREELLIALGELLAAPSVTAHPAVTAALRATWPDLTPEGLVTDLLTHRGLLAHCAPDLSDDERAAIRAHAADTGWHDTDLPLLDLARRRLGLQPVGQEDPAERAARRLAAQDVVDDLIAAAGEGSALHLLRGNAASADRPAWTSADLLEPEEAPPPRRLADRSFTHVVVDEAQDLTFVEWQALLWRCPSRSFTVVGDRAQSRAPFAESWTERMTSVGLRRNRVRRLSISYRTPISLMTPATAVITAARPGALVPQAVRTDGRPLVVERAPAGGLVELAVKRAAELRGQGTAAVVLHGDRRPPATPAGIDCYAPDQLQGLEMDVVVIVEPVELFPDDDAAAGPRLYVTLTRATQAVVVLHARDLPRCAAPLLAG